MKRNTASRSRIHIILGILVVSIIFMAVRTTYQRTSPSPASATPAFLSISNLSLETVDLGTLQRIFWTSENYSKPKVSLNVIRKVSDDPIRYELVRTIADATSNDGSATWVPARSDMGSGIALEVGCMLSAIECHASHSTGPLAVIDTGTYSNTAATYDAIEKRENN